MPVVTFDAGQTLVDLDLDFLAQRLGGQGIAVGVAALEAAAPAAWQRYEQLVEQGVGHPWKAFMATLLAGASVAEATSVAEWLFGEQPRHNLWRRPIPDMIELARELRDRDVQIAVLSNSEGGLAGLLSVVGIHDLFAAVFDSTVVGLAKPDPRYFAHALDALHATPPAVHIGDSWGADIEGALGAGWNAIWYAPRARSSPDPRVPLARTAADVRAALTGCGL